MNELRVIDDTQSIIFHILVFIEKLAYKRDLISKDVFSQEGTIEYIFSTFAIYQTKPKPTRFENVFIFEMSFKIPNNKVALQVGGIHYLHSYFINLFIFKTTVMTLALTLVPKICPGLGTKRMELVKWSQRRIHGKCRVGTREVVGFGCNGTAAYKDDAHFPFPSIRFQETNSNITVSTSF